MVGGSDRSRNGYRLEKHLQTGALFWDAALPLGASRIDTLHLLNAYLLETAVSERLEGASDFRVAGRSADRLLGAYYTEKSATETMARWATRESGDRVLEPSFGDGAFLRAVRRAAKTRGLTGVRLFGAELVQETFSAALRSRLLAPKCAFLGDFLSVNPFPVDAVIGNPPYVRLRHLPDDQFVRALHTAHSVLGEGMETSGSVWMPFVLHCLSFLRPGGRMALVLPHELTYVRYARSLWRKLGLSFDNLRLVRVHERLFPDILQEVVILFADGYGGSTRSVRFESLERVSQFTDEETVPAVDLSIDDIVSGKRVFLDALLPKRARDIAERVLAELAAPMPEICTFNIGYVAGDKEFFHPSEAAKLRYSIPASSLRPALTSGKQIRACGLRTSNVSCSVEALFLPPVSRASLTPAETRYIALGKELGVHKRYKCAVREPWFVVPGVRVPNLVLSVFAERPVLVINDAQRVASNSLLCGFLRRGTPESFVAAWYTSLTLLQIELQVHSLGGGVMVLVPGEVAKIRIPKCRPTMAHLRALDEILRSGDTDAAYKYGDESILQGQLGLSGDEVQAVREGTESLRHWRNSASGGVSGLEEGGAK
jgi:hypothetical protein